MKKTSIASSIMLFITAMMLSGCIFPYWEEGGRSHNGGGHRQHDNGRRGR